jgi:predicted secreted protein
MATEAMIGYGTRYRIWDATLTVPALVDVGEVLNVTPPSATADRIDATHMQSPGRRREYIAGLIDAGESSFEIQWVPGGPTDELIRGLMASGSVVQHEIEFPNGVTCSYDAAITGFERSVPLDDKLTATVTVAPSGEETWGEAA